VQVERNRHGKIRPYDATTNASAPKLRTSSAKARSATGVTTRKPRVCAAALTADAVS
jgi:hypothetical protein